MPALLLSASDVRRCLPMDRAVLAVEDAFRSMALGKARMPPKVYLDLPEFQGDFRAMPGFLGDYAGLKWVNVHPENPKRYGKAAVRALFVLSDPKDAEPLAVMDATVLTAMRTGAAGGVASKHLAVEKPKTVGFVGAGVQARTLLAAHRAVFGDSFEVLVADARRESAERFAAEAKGRVVSIEEAARADVLCTSTPAHGPVVTRSAVGPHTHINAIGADAAGKQELDPAILRDARVYVDDPAQAFHSGEVNVPIRDGLYRPEAVAGTLGEIIAGTKSSPRGTGLTVFDSTGLAVQDVAVGRVVFEEAKRLGLGTPFDFFA